MEIAGNVVTGLVALMHVYILALEMFLWGRAVKIFNIPKDQQGNELMRTMLKNQGLYNGFLAAGIVWGFAYPDPVVGTHIKLFFLGCVAVAGLYGAATAQVRILFIQTVPAALAAGLLLLR